MTENHLATAGEPTAAFSREREGAAVSARKRSRLKRQARVAARKALAVFVSVVLVVGLMPGFVAWGETQEQGALGEAQDDDTALQDEGESGEDEAAQGQLETAARQAGGDNEATGVEPIDGSDADLQSRAVRLNASNALATASSTYSVTWVNPDQAVDDTISGHVLLSGDVIVI